MRKLILILLLLIPISAHAFIAEEQPTQQIKLIMVDEELDMMNNIIYKPTVRAYSRNQPFVVFVDTEETGIVTGKDVLLYDTAFDGKTIIKGKVTGENPQVTARVGAVDTFPEDGLKLKGYTIKKGINHYIINDRLTINLDEYGRGDSMLFDGKLVFETVKGLVFVGGNTVAPSDAGYPAMLNEFTKYCNDLGLDIRKAGNYVTDAYFLGLTGYEKTIYLTAVNVPPVEVIDPPKTGDSGSMARAVCLFALGAFMMFETRRRG